MKTETKVKLEKMLTLKKKINQNIKSIQYFQLKVNLNLS